MDEKFLRVHFLSLVREGALALYGMAAIMLSSARFLIVAELIPRYAWAEVLQ